MFHDGDLQSGIAIAIREAKSVVCFIRDDDTESSTWENEWLQEDTISQLLAANAVLLRLQAGSEEAGFLSAFCHVQQVPSLIVIHNGQLREGLVTGVKKEDFIIRLQRAFGENAVSTSTSSSSASTNPTDTQTPFSQPATNSPLPSQPPIPPTPTPAPDEPAEQTASPAPAISSSLQTAQTLGNEGTATIKDRGKQRAEPEAEAEASTPNANAPARANWLAEQRQRQQDSRRERERVLAQIEADKAERKAKRENERKERIEREKGVEAKGAVPIRGDALKKRSSAETAKLQVRLLDGGTIRDTFPSDGNLIANVRPWIDSNLDTKAPYTFKQILAPQPARSISMSEEQETLQDLGLLPTATLVLQPVSSYAEAYGTSASTGGILNVPYNVVAGTYGFVSGTLTGAARWLRGGTYEEPGPNGQILGESHERHAPQNAATVAQGVRVRTLADQRADRGEDQQFYNGNSLDFQPDDR
ncbi:hypothetical protein EJ08DRAFT_654828 [Tothia fuscella]|uniref:UBX domain-containing protein 2 n=1 Tax=Tothia fuscella TaxID=1048955 RepID=A0A9P4NDX6_9PEZI|nr:hypothetical protein EJ08DRAFT_654828 [Tothia fuscella]